MPFPDRDPDTGGLRPEEGWDGGRKKGLGVGGVHRSGTVRLGWSWSGGVEVPSSFRGLQLQQTAQNPDHTDDNTLLTDRSRREPEPLCFSSKVKGEIEGRRTSGLLWTGPRPRSVVPTDDSTETPQVGTNRKVCRQIWIWRRAIYDRGVGSINTMFQSEVRLNFVGCSRVESKDLLGYLCCRSASGT